MCKFEFVLQELINQLFQKMYIRGQDISQFNEQ